jgi:hypothetical protein
LVWLGYSVALLLISQLYIVPFLLVRSLLVGVLIDQSWVYCYWLHVARLSAKISYFLEFKVEDSGEAEVAYDSNRKNIRIVFINQKAQ